MSVGAGNRAYYPGFDVLKFGMSVLIVAMHSKLGVELPFRAYQMLQITWTYAVPTFFAISAYLFCERADSPGALRHTLVRIAIVFGLWYIIVFPHTMSFLKYANYKEIIFAVLFTSCGSGFWFIKALFYNTIILYVCLKAPRWVFYSVGACAIALFLVLDVADIVLHYHPVPITHYFLFYYHTGVFFVGAFCYRFRQTFYRWRVPKVVLVAAIAIILLLCRNLGVYIAMKLLMPVLLMALFIDIDVADKVRCKRLRAMSIMMFVMQFSVLSIYTGIGNRLFAHDAAAHAIYECSALKFAVVMSVLLLVSWMIVRLEPRYPFLKYLH